MHYADMSKTVYMETNRLLQASTQISATSRCKNFRFFSTISRNYEYEFKSGRQKCIIDISAGLQSAVLRLCDGMAACVQTLTVILANGFIPE